MAVIAITEGDVDKAELDRLRGAVRSVVPAGEVRSALADELASELKRVADEALAPGRLRSERQKA